MRERREREDEEKGLALLRMEFWFRLILFSRSFFFLLLVLPVHASLFRMEGERFNQPHPISFFSLSSPSLSLSLSLTCIRPIPSFQSSVLPLPSCPFPILSSFLSPLYEFHLSLATFSLSLSLSSYFSLSSSFNHSHFLFPVLPPLQVLQFTRID